ncbi:MAG: hypothetical protein KDK23_14230 [Leptospiraceae bacterium]|nr:hypothetical protein [Leptospiraceae bacterium]
MEVRLANELGMKNVDYFKPLKNSEPVENPANLPGVPTADRQLVDQKRAMTSLNPNATSDRYQVVGGTINVMA